MNEIFCCIAAIGMHIGSAHIDPDPWLKYRGVNNFNPGLMVEFKSGATLGAYRNSINETSVYAGYTHHFYQEARVHPIVQVGVVTYEEIVWPAALAGLQVRVTKQWDARIDYFPKTKQIGAHVLHLMVIRNF